MLTTMPLKTGNAKKKQICSLLLVFLLIIQVLPVMVFPAIAATGTPIGAIGTLAEDTAFMSDNPNTQAYLFTTANNEKVRVIFYRDDLFRIWMADSGTGAFTEIDAADLPESQMWDLGGITSVDDLDIVVTRDFGSMPAVTSADKGTYYEFATPTLKLRAYKNPFLFEMRDADDNVVWSESQAITRGSSTTTQVLKTDENEHFYGGGMQVGSLDHKGTSISIAYSGWTEGRVANPVPFYLSTNGYGVFRNTYKTGTYNFTSSTVVETVHNERRFDAWYIYGPSFENVLDGYTELTGRPTLIPRWAIGMGDAAAYRQKLDTFEQGGNPPNSWGVQPQYTASQAPSGGFWHDEATAGVVKDIQEQYIDKDMPVSWILPNDGYGCEYNKETHPGGGLGAIAAGLMKNNTRLGLWVGQPLNYSSYNYTNGYPEAYRWIDGLIGTANGGERKTAISQFTSAQQEVMRDAFVKEIQAQADWGVRVYKIDVAWSSTKSGYKGKMAIFNQMLNNVESRTGERGMVITVLGWAGGQRYTTLWSGDQSGDNTYTKYHIPTFTGTSMSGYPYSTSDAAGIYTDNPRVYVRDLQSKLLVPTNIAMSNWGSTTTYANANPAGGVRATSDKRPASQYHHTAEEIEINRKYSKLKQQLIPYMYSYARKAYDKGSPIVRPMVYNFQSDTYTYDNATKYQYMTGDWFLVAPVLAPADTVRKDVYLPKGRWIDYWTGQEYLGPMTIDMDAPYDTLPLLVRGGAIIPMAQEHLYDGQETYNGKTVNDTLILDLYPEGNTSFDLYEDDGSTVDYRDGAYTFTKITSDAPKAGVVGPLTVTVGAAQGEGFEGQVSARKYLLNVHTPIKPGAVKLGGEDGTVLPELASYSAVDASETGGWFYDLNEKNGTLYIKTPPCATSTGAVVWVDAFKAEIEQLYTVTFETNGGSEVAPYEELRLNSTISAPVTVKDGFVFLGWYKDADFITRWNFDTDTVMNNITLYARWVVSGNSTVTFETNGAGEIPARTVSNGQFLTGVPSLKKGSDIFTGWYIDAACTKAWNLANDPVMGDMTLYAGWIAPLFHYSFENESELDVTGQPYAVISKTSTANISQGTGVRGGNSLNISANNGYVRLDANSFPYLNGGYANPFTISMWINPANVSRVATQYLFACSPADDWLLLRSGGYLGSYYFGSGNDTYSHTPIPNNEWTYVTATVSRDSVTYYINGEQVAQTGASSWLDNTANFFTFGGKSNSITSTNCFVGYMDEISFFGDTLTAEQVKVLYERNAMPGLNVSIKETVTNLLAGYRANIPVQLNPVYAELAELGAVTVTLDVDGTEYSAVADDSGYALVKVTEPLPEGTYTLIASAEKMGVQGSVTFQTIAEPANLWTPTFSNDGNVLKINFGAVPVPRYGTFDGYVTITDPDGNAVTSNNTTVSGNSILVRDVTINSIPEGSVIVVKGVKYPDLFPSYSFTFTLEFKKELTTLRYYSTKDGTWEAVPLTPAGAGGGIAVVEFDAVPSKAGINGVVGLVSSTQTATGYGNNAVVIRMNTTNYFDVYNNAGFVQTSLRYAGGQKYHFKIVIDLSAKTFDVFVTTPDGETVQIADDFVFRSSAPAQSNIGKLYAIDGGTPATDGGSFYVENPFSYNG